MEKKHILIVEDDNTLSKLLQMTLSKEGYSVAVAKNGAECDEQVQKTPPDLIILDINLNDPGRTGLDLCRELRKTMSMPIVMLSGSMEDTDKILALEGGANNYLTKPINPRVLISFIKTTFSTAKPASTQQGESVKPTTTILEFSQFVLNLNAFTLSTKKGKNIAVSPAEFKLLRVFAEHPRHVLSREKMLDYIGVNSEIYDRSIDRFIVRIRKKIEKDPKKPTLIKSVYGEGYLLDADVTKKSE